jgi:KDO2-lipid IV(A) lauroyltransferase
MAIHLQPGGKHSITVLPEIALPDESLQGQKRIERLTVEMTSAIEKLVRIYPQQWTWFHDRWHVRKERLENCGESGYLEMDGTG